MRTALSVLFVFASIFQLLAAHVDTLTIKSNFLSKSSNVVVMTPKNYSTSSEYSVLYLLHGAGGNYKSWIEKATIIKDLVDQHQYIIVCPDGGKTSWYFDSPIDANYQYESYITKELIPFIDKKYKTISNPKGRAITGLSMGGHGALYLSFRHQDLFGAAGSMSGGVDFTPFPLKWDIAKRLGSYKDNKQRWKHNTIVNMIHFLDGNLKLIIDCGYSDFFFDVNQNLHQKLQYSNIKHDFIVRPGSHNWKYWKNAIEYQMVFFKNYFSN